MPSRARGTSSYQYVNVSVKVFLRQAKNFNDHMQDNPIVFVVKAGVGEKKMGLPD